MTGKERIEQATGALSEIEDALETIRTEIEEARERAEETGDLADALRETNTSEALSVIRGQADDIAEALES